MPKPNILFIAVDDLNNWVNCLGKYPSAITPNLDRLAARGTVFTNAQCPAPICLPARTAVLSGVGPSTSGCYLNGREIEDQHPWTRSEGLANTCPLPVYFRRNGYRVLSSGKIYHRFNDEAEDAATFAGEPNWDDLHEPASTMAGMWKFRESHGVGSHPKDFEPLEGVTEPTVGNMWWGGLDDAQSPVQTDELTTRYCIEQLGKPHDKPFLLAPGFTRPHTPLVAPQRFFDLYDPEKIAIPEPDEAAFEALPEFAKQVALNSQNFDWDGGMHHQLVKQGRLREVIHAYLAATSFLDDCVGRILDALEASPHADNTLVVFWSDHGWSLGDHCHWKKWALWECVSNVPLIISRPSDTGGQICRTPVGTLNIYPTLADICGLEPRPEWEGRSLAPLLVDPEADWTEPALTTYGPGNHAVRTRQGTYIQYADGTEELYDPTNDPKEERNLAQDPGWQVVRDHLKSFLPENERLPLHRSDPDRTRELAKLQNGQVVNFGLPETGFRDKGFTITAQLRVDPDAQDAVIVHYNGMIAGFSLYIRDRLLGFRLRNVPAPLDWRNFIPTDETLEWQHPVPEERMAVELNLTRAGELTLRVDGAVVAQSRFAGTLNVNPIGMLSVGHLPEKHPVEKNHPLLPDFAEPAKTAFPGLLENVSIHFEP